VFFPVLVLIAYWLAVLLRPSLLVAVICLACMNPCSLVCCLLPNIDFLSAEYLSVCLVDPDDRLFVVSAFVQFSFLFRIEYIHFPSSTVQQDVNLNRDYMSMRFVSPPARISLFNTNIVFDFRLYMRFQDSTMPVKVFCA